VDYRNTAAKLEYGAWSGIRTTTDSRRYLASAADIASLIQLRGVATKPTGNFN
jgi:hypothetical protein